MTLVAVVPVGARERGAFAGSHSSPTGGREWSWSLVGADLSRREATTVVRLDHPDRDARRRETHNHQPLPTLGSPLLALFCSGLRFSDDEDKDDGDGDDDDDDDDARAERKRQRSDARFASTSFFSSKRRETPLLPRVRGDDAACFSYPRVVDDIPLT